MRSQKEGLFQELVKKEDKKYLRANFQYSILETFTLDTDRNEIIAREQYWKKVLKSKEFGYNANQRDGLFCD